MEGEYPGSIRSDLMIWQDTLGQGWVVVSGDDLPKYLYDNDAITDHVLFKRMKDSRRAGSEPFHPSDAELRISTDPPSHWWGNDLDRYDSDVLPDSLVVDCGGYPTDDGSEGAVFLYSNPLGRVEPDQQVTINWTEADAWVEASGGQIDLSQTFAAGPAGDDGTRSLLVLEYRTGDWSDDPWEIALFRDLEQGRSTSEDAELILQSDTYFSGGVGKNIKIVGDLDGDGLSDLVAGEPWTTTPSGSGQFHVVLGGSTGIASLDDVGMLYQPEYGGHAADIIIGELDIDGDGLDDIGVTSPYTGYADGESNLTWCGMINLYSGTDLAVGEGEPKARISGHRAGEQLAQGVPEGVGPRRNARRSPERGWEGWLSVALSSSM